MLKTLAMSVLYLVALTGQAQVPPNNAELSSYTGLFAAAAGIALFAGTATLGVASHSSRTQITTNPAAIRHRIATCPRSARIPYTPSQHEPVATARLT